MRGWILGSGGDKVMRQNWLLEVLLIRVGWDKKSQCTGQRVSKWDDCGKDRFGECVG